MKILELINKVAKKSNKKPEKIFRDFINMTYQLMATSNYYVGTRQEIPKYDVEAKRYIVETIMKKEFTKTPAYKIKYKHLALEHFYFTQLLEELIRKKPFTDVIGEIISEIIYLDKKNYGQCMTPPELASFMGKILGRSLQKSKKDILNIADDCGCGTGSLILSLFKETMKSNAKTINIKINDIDNLMVKISLIQLQFNNAIHNEYGDTEVNITALCGNTITDYKNKSVLFAPDFYDITENYVKEFGEYQSMLHRFSTVGLFSNVA